MGSPNERVPKSPLKQWVIYQEVDACRGIVVSRKVKENTSVEGPTNCNAATSTTRQCNNKKTCMTCCIINSGMVGNIWLPLFSWHFYSVSMSLPVNLNYLKLSPGQTTVVASRRKLKTWVYLRLRLVRPYVHLG